MDSAETQDYVSEFQGVEERDEEEAKDSSFIPSAVSEPRWTLHMCEGREEGFRFYQLAAIVVEEEGTAHTINLCKQCYDLMRMIRGERKVTASRWRKMFEQKGFRGKLRVAFGMGQFVRRMWEHFTIKKA